MNSEIKGNEKELLEMNEDDSTTYQNLQGTTKNSVNREVHSNQCLYQKLESGKISDH